MNSQIQEVICHLEELKEETDINKKLREKMNNVIALLTSDQELVIEKSLMELEELGSLNLPSYHQTVVWDIVSLLESLKK